ncbi:hypothetical protein V6N13_057152 [Hibiscus sabdariffa]
MARSALKGLNPQSLHPRVHLTPTKREFIDQAEAFYSRPNGGEERKSKLSYSKKPCAQRQTEKQINTEDMESVKPAAAADLLVEAVNPLVSWRPARIDHRTSRVAEPRLDRVHLRFAFISNSSCSINRSRNGLSELACFLECAFGLRPLGRKGTGLIDLRLNGRVRGGEDQGGRKPQRETFHRATRFFREALSQTFPLLPPQAKRFQDTRRPSESEQPRENLLGSSKKN